MFPQIEEILKYDFETPQMEAIKRLLGNLKSFKYLLTDTMKKDITTVLRLAIELKEDLQNTKEDLRLSKVVLNDTKTALQISDNRLVKYEDLFENCGGKLKSNF